MSVEQYFAEVEAVVRILDEFVRGCDPEDHTPLDPQGEVFTAIWQANELLARAYQVLLPMAQFEGSKVALVLPDVQREKPKKKAHLYDSQGRPLNAD